VAHAYAAVLSTIGVRRQQLEQELSDRNNALVETRQQSLRHGLEVRTNRLRAMATAPDLHEGIRRMRMSQIDNLQTSIEQQLRELDEKRQVKVSFRIVAGGLLDLIASGGESSSPTTPV